MALKYKIVEHPHVPDSFVIEAHKSFTGLMGAYKVSAPIYTRWIGGINTLALVFSVVALGYTFFYNSNFQSEVEAKHEVPYEQTPLEVVKSNEPLPVPDTIRKQEIPVQKPSKPAAILPVLKKDSLPTREGKPVLKKNTPVILSAEPVEGMEALYEYFDDSLKYPASMESSGISGEVVVAFTVTKEAQITEIEIVSGLAQPFNEEAIRLIKNMPKWKPASLNGHPITSRLSLPLIFNGNKTNGNDEN